MGTQTFAFGTSMTTESFAVAADTPSTFQAQRQVTIPALNLVVEEYLLAYRLS